MAKNVEELFMLYMKYVTAVFEAAEVPPLACDVFAEKEYRQSQTQYIVNKDGSCDVEW